MYYQECENLANEQPLIKNIILKIDEYISNVGFSGIFNPLDVATIINEKEIQVEIIFKELNNKGLLRAEEYVECSKCKSLMPYSDFETAINDVDIFECTQCQLVLTNLNQKKVIRYRLNDSKKYIKPKTNKISKKLKMNNNFNESLSSSFLNDPFIYTSLLRYYSKSLLKNEPFKDFRAIIIVHFLRDFIPFIRAMEILGLDLSNSFIFYKEYPYPQKKAIINWIDKQGIYVQPLRELNNLLSTLNNSKEIGKIIIVEDGGFVVPAIHRNYPNLLSNVIGAVEQTRRGIWNTEKWLEEDTSNKVQFPIISVATSRLKDEFEPRFIGKATIKNIEKMLPNIILNGKKVGLFGYGTIGKEVANWLRKNDSIISIFDQDSTKQLAAKLDGYITSTSISKNARDKFIVIGSSGKCSIDSTVISNLKHGCNILSVSSEQYEIDIDELFAKSKKSEDLFSDDDKLIGTKYHLSTPSPEGRIVDLLANGYPINFWGMESMPEQASDLILSLILLSATELALGNLKDNKIDNEAVNKLADKYDISKKYLETY